MKEYRTIIITDPAIRAKVELYRHFLEKSEFKSCLDRAIFLTIDSVEELSSTELNNVENFIYLFGEINKEQYQSHYSAIEEKRKKYQNATHYMLFCQDKYQEDAYDISRPVHMSSHQTFSIEILDEDVPGSDVNPELKDDLAGIKLLVLAMAICKFNEGKCTAHFESYFMCVNLKLDYRNIYFAVIHDFCEDADLINEKKLKQKTNEEMISLLKKRKASRCEGCYSNTDVAMKETGLKPKFSDYKSISALQRDMEVAFNIGRESLDQSIESTIDVARCAMSIEEECTPDFVIKKDIDGQHTLEFVETSKYLQNYMIITEVPEENVAKDVAQPSDLLSKPVEGDPPDPIKFKALIPLAREFDSRRKFSPLSTLLTAFCIAATFALINGLIYFSRYKNTGFVGVAKKDVIQILVFFGVSLLLTGVTGLIVQLIRYFFCKSIFKKVYNILKRFLDSRKAISDKIRDYIDKYLTVYYNYHIKHSRIETLTEENAVLEHEINMIKEQSSPVSAVADTICALNGSRIEIPKIDTGLYTECEDDEVSPSMKRFLEKTVEASTLVTCAGDKLMTITPWASEIHYGIGNLNCGGAR